ncbi:hypothetical protein H0H93_001405 [Arthromyces matolae]|nr:hypothetical protein H0H93_001405 [Arthromyces matolae]
MASGDTTPPTITFEALGEINAQSGGSHRHACQALNVEPLRRLLRSDMIYQLSKYIDPIAGGVLGKTASTKPVPVPVDSDDRMASKNDNKNKGPVYAVDQGSATLLYLFLHRIISAGNSLWGKKGNLSDLKYARLFNMPEGHDPRKGTPAFMAAEYLRGSYYLTARGTATGALSGSDGAVEQVLQDLKKWARASGPLADDPHRARFNFYHDLESVFWISIWFLHYRLPKKLMQSRPNLPSLQRSAQKLFLNIIAENRSRNNLIFEKQALRALYQILYPIYTPEFEVLLESVVVCVALASAYSELEATNPVDGLWDEDKFDAELYTVLKGRFNRMIAAMKVDADYEAEDLFN